MSDNTEKLLQQIAGEIADNAYEASDSLAEIGSDEAIIGLIKLLDHAHADNRYLAARTLSKIENNEQALEPLLDAINNKDNSSHAGDLVAMLEGFDISNKYVEVFKLYLFGSFKVSMMAKELLDYKEFDITPRVLKKATKHWNHYTNNVKQDDVFELKKIEVEEMLQSLNDFINA